MTYPHDWSDSQILQTGKAHRAFQLVEAAFLFQPIQQIRRNHQHFQAVVVQGGDGFADGRFKIPA